MASATTAAADTTTGKGTAAKALPAAHRNLEGPRKALVTGAAVLGVAALMILLGEVAAYLTLRAPAVDWPPKGRLKQNYFGTMMLITGAALIFGAEWLVWAVRRSERRQAGAALVITVLLLVTNMNALIQMMGAQQMTVGSSGYATVWFSFMFTVLSIYLVTLGLLIVLAVRTAGRQVSAHEPELARAAAIWVWVAAFAWTITWVAVFAASR